MERKVIRLLALVLMAGCAKDPVSVPAPSGPVMPGRIVLNEVVDGGSMTTNEFGAHADWIELYNPGPVFYLEAGTWFLTDDGDADPHKFELPEMEIPAMGYAIIWCDGQDVVMNEVHTNFALSQGDGSVHLVHGVDGKDRVIDAAQVTGGMEGDASMGRSPDGTARWGPLSPQTPGAPNEAAPEP